MTARRMRTDPLESFPSYGIRLPVDGDLDRLCRALDPDPELGLDHIEQIRESPDPRGHHEDRAMVAHRERAPGPRPLEQRVDRAQECLAGAQDRLLLAEV